MFKEKPWQEKKSNQDEVKKTGKNMAREIMKGFRWSWEQAIKKLEEEEIELRKRITYDAPCFREIKIKIEVYKSMIRSFDEQEEKDDAEK